MMEELFVRYDHEISLIPAVAFLILMGKLGSLLFAFCWDCLARVLLGIGASRRPSSSSSSTSNTSTKNHYSFKSQIAQTLALVAIASELHLVLWMSSPHKDDGLHTLIKGTDARLEEILARVPAIEAGPRPPFLFRNRHVQFFPWLVQNEIHRLEGIPFQRIHVPVTDCLDKATIMEGTCHWKYDENETLSMRKHQPVMNDTITLDVFPPFDDDSTCSSRWKPTQGFSFNASSPVILFSPGLRCHSQDMPGNMIIRKAYEQGFRSIVVHRRGHTPNQRLQSPRWNLFGDVDDLEQVYWFVKERLVAPHTAMFLHGISSGTAVTVTALSKWDRRRREEPEKESPAFVASVAMTPGYDISKVLGRDRFLFPYHDLLLPGVKDHFVRQNEDLLRAHNSTAVDLALAATSLQGFVDASVPFAGYENTTVYYQDTNPINEIRDITTPKLVLNALDDPCCNINNLYDPSPHSHHQGKTYAQLVRETENAMVAVTRTGSHIPFLCTRDRWLPFTRDPLTGGWMLHSWGDQVSIDFYRATLDVYGERRFH